MAKCLVYGLIDPLTGELRYIGKSSTGLRRPNQHWNPNYMNADKNTLKVNWIKSLLKKNTIPIITVLEYHDTQEEVSEAEIDLIAYYKSIGCRLTNIRPGGEGFSSEEARKLYYARSEESRKLSKHRMLEGAIRSRVRQKNNLKLRKPIIATNTESGEERWYLSASHAAADGISSRSAISNCLRPSWRCTANRGWTFRFVDRT